MAKRASASSSSVQPSQFKRARFTPTDQSWNGSKRNLVLGSCSTEEDAQRVCGEEPEPAKSHSAGYCQSCTGNSLKAIVQRMHSVENSFQKLKELVELSIIHSPHFGRIDGRSTEINDVRNLRLQFQTKLSDPLFTGRKLRGVGGALISVALIDANTGDVITSGLESSIKLDVVVLEGDFNKDDEDDWAHEEFEKFVVKERQQKGLLLTGDLQVTLKGGIGELGELIFTDNSSWNRSKRFRIGLKKASGYCGNTRIREAKTDAFRVKEHRGESSKKHDIPAFGDEIWRLKMIAKDGKYHQKLSEAGIHKVGDFLLQLFTDPMKLKEILGISSNSTKWDTLENHARSCKLNWKLYLYCTDGTRKHGAVFNTDRQLIGLIKDRVYCATDRLSADDLEHGDAIVKNALDNKNDVMEFNGETFSPSVQKKSSSSIPCQVLEEQVENQGPVQSNLAPRLWAAPGVSEAPLANVGLTAEEHDGAIALALPVRLQNTNYGNAMKLSVDESVHLAARKPISTDSMNVLIPQGDIHSSRQMDYMVNENGPPSEPPLDPISSFQHSSTLPHPQGNHVVEGFQSIDSDDILGDRCPDDLASSDLQVSSITPMIHKRKKKNGKVEKSIRGEEDREFAEREGKREENDRERNKKKNKKEEERRGAIAMDVSSSRLNCVMQGLVSSYTPFSFNQTSFRG
ncbi:hypothetical protein ACJRO7_021560 [Eucalyptus globulus]|uniref:Calmodulin-binding protein n=1 Tax=Eucalyptus globulus TaxID=34317 RepID=A0ABD3KQ56_EUCGL